MVFAFRIEKVPKVCINNISYITHHAAVAIAWEKENPIYIINIFYIRNPNWGHPLRKRVSYSALHLSVSGTSISISLL